MRGQNRLMAARMAGFNPEGIWVYVRDEKAARGGFLDPECALDFSVLPEVAIEPDDCIPALDMRFVYGCIVHLIGKDIDRSRLAFKRIREFEPSKIIVADFGEVVQWSRT